MCAALRAGASCSSAVAAAPRDDYPATAQSIAAQIGLSPRNDTITGPELAKMGDEELQRKIATANVFARVVPEQKLSLVSALKANGEVVEMTGDGVNCRELARNWASHSMPKRNDGDDVAATPALAASRRDGARRQDIANDLPPKWRRARFSSGSGTWSKSGVLRWKGIGVQCGSFRRANKAQFQDTET